MRIAIAQINPVVGDIDGNVELVLDALERAEREGARLAVFPELTLVGCPPLDLIYNQDFISANLAALKRVAASARIDTIVGFVDRQAGALYNAAAFVSGQQVARVYHKRLLSDDGAMGERAYFLAGGDPEVFEYEGLNVALTVCEDIWDPSLARGLSDMGVDVVFNIAASPFYRGKSREREEILCSRARDNQVWIACCNLVGGQDELVFDGRSVVISPDGSVVARAKTFAEDIVFADVGEPEKGDRPRPGSDEINIRPVPGAEEELYDALVLGTRDYVLKNGFTDVVLGLSGGVDSALVAAIAVDALGPSRVHGAVMPSRYSSEGSAIDARELARALGIETIELPVEPAFGAFLETLALTPGESNVGLTQENLQARIRGTLLMALSNRFGWLVLATGNKSESSVGYATLYGDMVGGFAPLCDVMKTSVYKLARWRNAKGEVIPAATLAKPPSAELRPGQTDQDSLPPYDLLDEILALYLEENVSAEEIVSIGYDRATVEEVVALVDGSEFKRRQSAVGPVVTPNALGRSRRMPLTNRYGRKLRDPNAP